MQSLCIVWLMVMGGRSEVSWRGRGGGLVRCILIVGLWCYGISMAGLVWWKYDRISSGCLGISRLLPDRISRRKCDAFLLFIFSLEELSFPFWGLMLLCWW